MSNWVQVGAEVIFSAERRFDTRAFGCTAKIVKVLKNGNFKVEGSDQQFRPFEDHATATGNAWSKSQVFHLSDELRPAVALWHRVKVAHGIVNTEMRRIRMALDINNSADELLKIADEILNRKIEE